MTLRKTWEAARPYLPRPAVDLLLAGHAPAMRARCWYRDRSERPSVRGLGVGPIPPAYLRYRVGGTPDLGTFLDVGRRTADDLERALAGIGRSFADFESILDFGCGCGRTLLWVRPRLGTGPGRRAAGTDVDARAIRWCRGSLPFADFAVNRPWPPIDAPDGAYDLVYAISVFTHLDRAMQEAWLDELGRILRPGGIALVTVHGDGPAEKLPGPLLAKYRAEGFLFRSTDSTRGLFPSWYRTTYQSPAQVAASFGRAFRVLDHIPRGINDHQDLVVLERP